MSFGAPVELFTARYGYTALNAALVQADLGVFAGIEIGGSDETPVKDITLFIPINSAFEDISSVLATANQSTLQDVLSYHLIQDNIIFSPSITNTTVATVQGGELAFTVTDEGDVFVNNAKVILPNVLLYEGVAHIIDRYVIVVLSCFQNAPLTIFIASWIPTPTSKDLKLRRPLQSPNALPLRVRHQAPPYLSLR